MTPAGLAFLEAVAAQDFDLCEQAAATLTDVKPSEIASLEATCIRQGNDLALGILLCHTGRTQDGLPLLLARSPRRAAAILTREGRDVEAGKAWELHLRDHPEDAGARISLATLLLRVGRSEACLRVLASASKENPEVARLQEQALSELGLGAVPLGTDRRVGDENRMFGRFIVEGEIASSASSRLLRARDLLRPDAPDVVVKVFVSGGQHGVGRDAHARFLREIEVLQAIDAPGLLKPRAMYDEGPTLVLPFLEGGDLERKCAEEQLSPIRAVEITCRVLTALDAAHRRGIVHRDIKPANVLFDRAGGAYLVDFGVAHLGDAAATATAGVVGTLRWMSPEQLRGEAATTASDLFAVGRLLGEMLKLPDELTTSTGPAELPTALVALVRSLQAEDPNLRPASAATALERLKNLDLRDAGPTQFTQLTGKLAPNQPEPSRPNAIERFAREHDAVGDCLVLDTWLERAEMHLTSHDPRIAICQVLVQTNHPVLPKILGTLHEKIRLEHPGGDPVSSLSEREFNLIGEALALLHDGGTFHGSVRQSLIRTPQGVVLRMPYTVSGTTDRDRDEVASLRGIIRRS